MMDFPTYLIHNNRSDFKLLIIQAIRQKQDAQMLWHGENLNNLKQKYNTLNDYNTYVENKKVTVCVSNNT